MPDKTAKLFTNGGSQAVRLPAELRFGSNEVYIRRDAVTGDVVLSERPIWSMWSEFFTLRNSTDIPNDFMVERPLNTPLNPSTPFKDEV